MIIKNIKNILKKILLKIFKLGLKFKLIILPAHYYVPISNILDLKKDKSWQKKSNLYGIKINLNQQIANIRKIVLPFKDDYKKGELYDKAQKLNAGPGYGVIEAQALYGVIKYFKPKKIIEIGSGVSTYIMLNADAKNIVCIEPYPSKFLKKNTKLTLIKKKLQHCDNKMFENLSKGDFLFIDSTHTLKIGSDVSKIYLDIIPKLKPGIIVHIHDIYFPYNFQRDANNTMFQWLETQMLQALLVNNSKLEILFCMSHLHYKNPDQLKKIFPMYYPQKDNNGISLNNDRGFFPSSIYLITK
jgi:predicted O-methyltransferase YrrM